MLNHQKGLLITFVGVLILTPDAMLMRLIDGNSFTLAFWRGVSVGIVFILLGFLQHYRDQKDRSFGAAIFKAGRAGLIMGLSFGLSSFCFVSALEHTTVANLLVILALSPLFAGLMSRLLMKETMRLSTILAMISCFAGIFVVFYDGLTSNSNGIGEIYALAAAFLMALNLTLIRMKPEINSLAINGIGLTFVGLLMIPLAPSLLMPMPQAGYLVILCALVLPLSFVLIITGPKYISSAEVGLLMLIETALGPYWVWLAVGEQPSNHAMLGGGIVLSTLILHALWRLNARPKVQL